MGTAAVSRHRLQRQCRESAAAPMPADVPFEHRRAAGEVSSKGRASRRRTSANAALRLSVSVSCPRISARMSSRASIGCGLLT